MELLQIRMFHYAATLGSFTEAANFVFRTQSAVSQQIKALEEELGFQLFDRIGKRKLVLTPAGEKLFEFSSSLIRNTDQFLAELEELHAEKAGRLRIAAPFAVFYYILPETIKQYNLQFPQIELTLRELQPLKMFELLRAGEIDFGIELESVVPKDLYVIRWKKANRTLLVPLGHPLTKIKRINLKHIAAYPLLLTHRSRKRATSKKLMERFEELGVKYRILMEATSVVLSSLYVAKGLGISLLSFPLNENYLNSLKEKNLELIVLDHLFEPDYMVLTMRKDKLLSSYEKSFIDMFSSL